MILTMEKLGIEIEVQHHEVGTAGQAEIDMHFDTLLTMADKLMLYKYVVKSVAEHAGYTATFMPKPLFQDNGSGMHVHQSLWSGGVPLFYSDTGYAGLSDMGRWYIGGLLVHARSICRVRRANHEFLPTAGPWLRSARQPRLLATEPLRRMSHPGLLEEPQGEARRVPMPRPPRAIHTSLLPRCSWPALMAWRTTSSLLPQSMRTCLSCHLMNWR